MRQNKAVHRVGIIFLLVVSMLLCPLARGKNSRGSPAYADEDFPTVPPVKVTFTAPVGTPIPIHSPIPTLFQGQYFEGEGADVPNVVYIEKGNEEFGYGPVEGEQGQYLLWVTEKGEKGYLVVNEKAISCWVRLITILGLDTRMDLFIILISWMRRLRLLRRNGSK
jgi:hypothetical protein